MSESVQEALSRVFGFDEFRPNQEEIVSALLEKRDVFAVMPTGGGKSLCYQLPAHLLPGLCVVVSPLISLMKDQVDAAQATGLRAEFLNSSLLVKDRRRVFQCLENNDLDLLYVSPERFAMPDFLATLKQAEISFFAIDEAHCISEWGHDFRPDYLSLSKIVDHFPKVAVAAFTATATHQVQDDIIKKLQLRNPHLTRASFDRPNLFYQVAPKEDLNMQLLAFLRERPDESGIIYRTTRKNVESTAAFLQGQGIKALPYHAGLSDKERKAHQEQFNRDEINVVVATIAFGMGIDKSNVRFVLHGDLPKNVESYYQETGRAGRDGDPAHCCLYFSPGDTVKIRYFIDQIEDLVEQKIAISQLNKMVQIAQANACRRRNILDYFGETYPKDNCKTCDICTGDVERIDATIDAQKILSAIYRTGGKFGAVHIADIVAGADTERIRRFGHDKIKTYGAGSDRDKRHWRRIIDALIAQDCIRLSDDQYSVLQLAPKATPILRGQAPFRILCQKETKTARRSLSSGDFSAGLFDALRTERRRVARDLGVPPFVVFSDHTLHEMARYFPATLLEMRQISGVGVSKLDHFGDTFLAVIDSYKEAHPDEADERSILQVPVVSKVRKKPKGGTVNETLSLIKEGLNVEQICSRRNLSPATITQHIEKLIQKGETLDVDQFIDAEKRIEVEALFRDLNADTLGAIVEAGKGDVSYEQARLVRAFMA
ncbi:DNA helicase RecQ [Tichowtungia aerotolerans]|uniref:DNA helicase RecQ n=1 Tax=Tichowtungia aerotolerans TaxID=2697043 RepID=A0A6P1M8Q4_9BACT|nr:DNA helicase RecQ [Tichowtungia aerotolerans]QHI68498.1 DNA helicase RecQ [Tichowtungia aerotolerans]